MKPYDTFTALTRQAAEGHDFTIDVRYGPSGIAVMAPHGGGIEPGTDIIADAVAGADHSFYAFKGIRTGGNKSLHLASARFDEPKAVDLTRRSQTIVTLHGCRGNRPEIYVGGLDRELMEKIADHLVRRNFSVQRHLPDPLRGIAPGNLCNCGRRGKGVQLELSYGQRRQLFGGNFQMRLPKNDYFQRFISSVREPLTASSWPR
jgi:phage replication-related protein YjqB (UPF0714/DUF867 family)